MGRPIKKHPGGRPTVMTDQAVGKLEEAFSWGCTDREACLHADISLSTLYDYQIANPGFSDRKAALKENPVRLARQSVINAIPRDPKLAFDYLKSKKSDEFSERKRFELTGDPDKPIDFTFKIADSKDPATKSESKE